MGRERRSLVQRLRNGSANWLCNVGIATEGFNWPEASVIGMCAPTLSRAAYVQRAGRGTRPLGGLLNGLQTSMQRLQAIETSSKPYMTILDFVGISANLNLISAESFLEPIQNETKEPKERKKSVETDEERPCDDSEGTESEKVRVDLGISRIVKSVQSDTLFTSQEFDPFEASGEYEKGVELKVTNLQTETLSEKQYALLKRCGVCDDATLTRQQAQQVIKFIAGKGFRLNNADKEIAKKLYRDIRNANV
jgi:superfamily II DNA or RNA helicase